MEETDPSAPPNLARLDLLAHVLPAAFHTILPLVGLRDLRHLAAASRAAAHDVADYARGVAWREQPRLRVARRRLAAFAERFPLARALDVQQQLRDPVVEPAAAGRGGGGGGRGAPVPAAAADGGGGGDGGGAAALAAALRRLLDLELLSASYNNFDAAGARLLAEALGAGCAPRLASLHLDNGGSRRGLMQRGFGDEGLAALCELALPRMPRLRVLRLSMNSLTPAGAAALGAALPLLPRLRELDLATNGALGAAGAAALARGLGGLGELRELNVGFCGLGGAGVAALAAALPPGLVKLGAAGNGVDAEGARAAATALQALQAKLRAPRAPPPLWPPQSAQQRQRQQQQQQQQQQLALVHLNLTFNLLSGDDEDGLRARFREVLPELHVAI